MSILFEQTEIKGMTLSNRFVRSATWEGMAGTGGEVTPKLIETMGALAKGGVGLIITSHAYVRPEGQASPWQIGVFKDALIAGLEQMTGVVHDRGGKIVMQLAHSGSAAPEKITGQPPMVVSDFEGSAKTLRREMTVSDIRGVVVAFGAAAERARSSGFDGVQIHAAHGYLLSQFLSPAHNRRQDEYGGDIRNRARALLEVYQAVRKSVGNDYPVLVKLNCRDFVENGLSLEDSITVGCLLANAGLDAIEVSGGVLSSLKLSPVRSGINSEDKEAYFKPEAEAFKKKVGTPLILVGGARSFEVAQHLVEKNVADYISMSRPFIREPDLIRRWKDGDRRKAECRSDNRCFGPGVRGEGITCVTAAREKARLK